MYAKQTDPIMDYSQGGKKASLALLLISVYILGPFSGLSIHLSCVQVTATWPLRTFSKKNALGAKSPTISLIYAAAVLRLNMKENILDPSPPPSLLPPSTCDLKYLFTN